jgi:chemotaxis protein CheX
MPIATEFTEEEIQTNLVRAVADVFKTMLDRVVLLLPDDAPPPPVKFPPEAKIVGTVGFAGDANGVIYLWFSELFAKRCTGHMLGLAGREFEEMDGDSVCDAVGELTNMIAGSFKNRLCDAGLPCKLSIPATVSGTDFTILPRPSGGAYHREFRFDCLGQPVVVEVVLKIAPSGPAPWRRRAPG